MTFPAIPTTERAGTIDKLRNSLLNLGSDCAALLNC